MGKVVPMAGFGSPLGTTSDGQGTIHLTPREVAFVAALAEGQTVAEAAAAAKVSARTAYRWKARPDIVGAVVAREQEHLAQARVILVSGAARAARELERLCSHAKPDAARINACKAVIEAATELRELADVRRRLDELEAERGAEDEGE